jgi:DNA-binding XRE family transcriptional regulator
VATKLWKIRKFAPRVQLAMGYGILAYDAAKSRNEEAFPAEVADGIIDGENPIRVFREYRGLTQEKLAKAAHIARPYLAELEACKKQGSVAVLKKIARLLKVGLEDIAS